MTTQNPNHDLLRGSVLPAEPVDVGHQLPVAHDSNLRHKIDNLKARVIGRSQTWKRSLASRAERTNATVRDGVHSRISQMQQSMRTQPMLWAGIAGGTGVALGLIGRFVHWRSKRAVPDLVIIDATC